MATLVHVYYNNGIIFVIIIFLLQIIAGFELSSPSKESDSCDTAPPDRIKVEHPRTHCMSYTNAGYYNIDKWCI